MGLGLLIVEFSRPHSETPQSVELLWTSDRLVAETSTRQHKTQETEFHDPGGFRIRSPSKWAAANPRLRSCDHWDGKVSSCDSW